MAALDGAIARHRRLVLVLWLVVVAAAVPFALRQGDNLTGGGFKVAGTDSAKVEGLLQTQVDPVYRQVVMAAVLVRDADAKPSALRAAVNDVVRATRAVDGVELRAKPAEALSFVRSQRPGDPATLPMVVDADEYGAPDVATDLRKQLDFADGGYDHGGVRMYLVGQGALWAGMVDLTKDDLADAELVGFPIVLVILLLVFGSLTAALLPLALGVAAITLTGAVIYALSTTTLMNVYSTNMASMIGIGVAVDYSLFVVVRYREELRAGRSPADARRKALTTSGVAIVFSGLTVVVALASLFIIDTAALRSLAAGAIIVVAIAVVLTATLLPALLAVLGGRISPEPQRDGRWWGRWAERVMGSPKRYLAASSLLLLVLAAPALGLALGDGALRQFPADHETRTGFEVASKATGPGQGAPLKVLVPQDQAERSIAILRSDPEVEDVVSRATTRDGRLVVIAIPRHNPDSDQAKDLVDRMRAALPAGVLVGGNSAAQLDFDDEVLGSLPLVVALILVLSFVSLAALLRSVVLPLKAILTNLLSVAAAFGVLTIVYVWGWTDGLFGWESPGYVDTFTVPLIIAAVFGLSMDYEVFLLSRIRERYELHGDTRRSVGEALVSSARTITGAALIMVAVFGVFIGTGVPAIQQIGLGCAVAIALDATLVRLVLVPAAMVVLGRWNWWWPRRGAAKAIAVGTLIGAALVFVGCGGGDDSDSAASGGGGAAAKRSAAVTVAGVGVEVTPSTAGTPESPQGVELDVRLRLGSPQGVQPPPAVSATLELPSGTEVDGSAYPSCGLDVLKRRGVEGCPANAIMGRGSVRGLADTSPAIGDVVVVNGGEHNIWLFTTLTNPVRVQDVIEGNLEPIDDGGTRLTLAIPKSLQVVAGVPIALRELRLHAGGGAWLATTSCPSDGRWPYRGQATFEDKTTADYADAVPCS